MSEPRPYPAPAIARENEVAVPARRSALSCGSPEPLDCEVALPSHDKVSDSTSASTSIDWIAVVTCEGCGSRRQLSAATYMEGWRDGMRCGLCAPVYPVMHVRFVLDRRDLALTDLRAGW